MALRESAGNAVGDPRSRWPRRIAEMDEQGIDMEAISINPQ